MKNKIEREIVKKQIRIFSFWMNIFSIITLIMLIWSGISLSWLRFFISVIFLFLTFSFHALILNEIKKFEDEK